MSKIAIVRWEKREEVFEDGGKLLLRLEGPLFQGTCCDARLENFLDSFNQDAIADKARRLFQFKINSFD